MLQVGGCFPFSASDQLIQSWPSSDGGGSTHGTFDGAETASSQALQQWPTDNPATPSVGYSWELYPYSLGESESAITRDGTPGSDASGWRGFANICPRKFIAGRAAIAIRNTGGNWLRLGLFDVNGDRLGVTPRFPPVANTIIVASFETPVQLEGSTGYYLAYWSDDTTGNVQFSCLSGRSTSNRSPLMQRNDGNEGAGNLSAAFAFTPLRPWMAVFE